MALVLGCEFLCEPACGPVVSAVFANPAPSATACLSVALLGQQFGWSYFEGLRANSAKMGRGSGQVVDDTVSGDIVASLAVDHITLGNVDKGAAIGDQEVRVQKARHEGGPAVGETCAITFRRPRWFAAADAPGAR